MLKLISNNSLFKKVFHYVNSGMINIIFLFISGLIVARIYGPGFLGKLSLYTVVCSIIAHAVTLGTGQAFLMEISSRSSKISNTFSSLMFTYVIGASLLGIFYVKYNQDLDVLLFLLVLIEIAIMRNIKEKLIQGVFRVENNTNALYLVNFLSGFGKLLITIICAIWFFNYYYLQLGFTIISIIVVLTSLFIIKNSSKLKFRLNFRELKNIYLSGIPFFITTLSIIGNDYASTIILSKFTNNHDLGQYSAALKIITMFLLIYGLVSQAIFPEIRKNYIDNDYILLSKNIKSSKKILLGSSFLIIVLFLCFGKFIVNVLYGQEFKDSYLIMTILSSMLVGSALNMILFPLLQVMNKRKIVIYLSFFCATLNILLNFLFILFWGVIGAAIASSLAMIIGGIITNIIASKQLTKWRINNEFEKK